MKNLMKVTFASILAVAAMSAPTKAADSPAKPSAVTAIDILLEPDATMLQHSADNNARVLKVFPKGFSLNAAHTPHITMLQCFVRTADLKKVYADRKSVV